MKASLRNALFSTASLAILTGALAGCGNEPTPGRWDYHETSVGKNTCNYDGVVSNGGGYFQLEADGDGYTIEQGPNSLLKSPRLVDLVRLLKLEDKTIAADESANKRYILSGGKLEAMGPKSFVNGYFSLKTIFSLAREPFVRSKSPENESVAEFVSRRISSEFLDKAIDPFVSGVYAGDPSNLSMRSAFPKLYEMERDFGSLIMGTFRRKTEKADPNFPRTFSFHGGLKTLIDALADEIEVSDGFLGHGLTR